MGESVTFANVLRSCNGACKVKISTETIQKTEVSLSPKLLVHSKKKPKDFFLLYNLLRFLQMNKTCQSMHLQRLLLAVNIDGTSQHYAHGRHHAVMLKIYQAWYTDVFLQHFPNSHPDPDHSATGQVSLPASFSPESCISVPSTDRHNKRSYRQKQEQEGLRGKFNWRWWWSDRESSTNLTLCYKKKI